MTMTRAAVLLSTIFGLAAAAGIMASATVETLKRPKAVAELAQDVPAVASLHASTKRLQPVVVAVIDTGVDFSHPDLRGTEWINPGETGLDLQGRDKSRNGIDDDGDGLIDDVHGWNFVRNQSETVDRHGHGTHIAGLVAGQGRMRIRGEAPNAKIMALQYYDPGLEPARALKASIKAMRYAIDHGVDIINYSGGGEIPNEEERALMQEAARRGILVVAAAGNEGSDSTRSPFYPANYGFSNILSVTAIDQVNQILPSSNFGLFSVGIAAYGSKIESTLPGGQFGTMTGTSQATGIVTGVSAAMILSDGARGERSIPEILIQRILSSSRTIAGLQGKTQLGSSLAAERALAMREASSQPGTSRLAAKFSRALARELKGPSGLNATRP